MADSDKADSDKHCVVELVCPGTIPTLDLNGLLSKLYQCMNPDNIDVTLLSTHPTQTYSMTIMADGNVHPSQKRGVPKPTLVAHIYVNFDDVDLSKSCEKNVKKYVQQVLNDAKCSNDLDIMFLMYKLK